jgi:bacitracin transport system ATP-binding protein
MEYILRTKNLTKRFRNKVVVEGVDMTIKRGEIYGFLGPNGSGKTTTLRMLLGLITPTSGEIELFGNVIDKEKKPPYERIGNMIGPGSYGNLTVVENLKIHARLMGFPNSSRINEVLHIVDLYNVRNTLCKKLSLGMKQRVGVARAILHKPELLILDEPLNAIDPSGTKKIREMLVNLAQKYKTTVLITSHVLSDIEQMASKIGIIYHGNLLEEIDYESLQNRNREYLELRVNPTQKAVYLLENKLHINEYEVVEENVIRLYQDLNKSNEINRFLIENQIEVIESKLSKNKLESYYLKLIGGEQRV